MGAVRRLFGGSAAEMTERVAAAHERLDAKCAERDRLRAASQEAELVLERAHAAIAEADSAERELESAEAAAATDAAIWAESGAREQPGSGAFDRAAAARDRAYRTRLQAGGVRKALPKLQADVDAARQALEPMEAKIDGAVAEIVFGEVESEIEALRGEFRSVFKRFTRLCALRNLLSRNVPGTPWARHAHPCIAMTHADCRGRLDEELAELTAIMKEPHPDDSIEAAEPLVRRFRQLRGGI